MCVALGIFFKSVKSTEQFVVLNTLSKVSGKTPEVISHELQETYTVSVGENIGVYTSI
jgi:hypothetical protein